MLDIIEQIRNLEVLKENLKAESCNLGTNIAL